MSILGKENGNIILKDDYLEIYIVNDLFTKGLAERRENRINVFGIVPVGVFENGKRTDIKRLQVPARIDLFVYDNIEDHIDLFNDDTNISCTVLKYNKGQIIMQDGIVEDSDNVEDYLKMLMNARLPKTIAYDDTFIGWLQACTMNHKFLGTPAVIMELIVTAVYRDPNNPSREFGILLGERGNEVSPYSYIQANTRKTVQQTNTFGAFSFEDFNTSAIMAMNRSKNKIKEIETPLEKIIYM